MTPVSNQFRQEYYALFDQYLREWIMYRWQNNEVFRDALLRHFNLARPTMEKTP